MRGTRGTKQALYNNCWISLNCSSVNLPGWTPLTSRPKSLNLEGSAVGGRGRGKVSIAIVISGVVSAIAEMRDLFGLIYPLRSVSDGSHASSGGAGNPLPKQWVPRADPLAPAQNSPTTNTIEYLHQIAGFARGKLRQNSRSLPCIMARVLPTACALRYSPLATDGNVGVPYYFLFERGHRSHRYREGCVGRDTDQDRSQLHQWYSYNDQWGPPSTRANKVLMDFYLST